VEKTQSNIEEYEGKIKSDGGEKFAYAMTTAAHASKD
jgi:hypothetical protein